MGHRTNSKLGAHDINGISKLYIYVYVSKINAMELPAMIGKVLKTKFLKSVQCMYACVCVYSVGSA